MLEKGSVNFIKKGNFTNFSFSKGVKNDSGKYEYANIQCTCDNNIQGYDLLVDKAKVQLSCHLYAKKSWKDKDGNEHKPTMGLWVDAVAGEDVKLDEPKKDVMDGFVPQEGEDSEELLPFD